jgi:MFS transporter, ACS family, glucarate transporter
MTTSPTRVRYGVLAFACTLAMITYMDRVCMASAAGEFVEELGLNSVADLGLALGAFALAYSLFEVPSGWLGDVFGPRRVLIRIVLWWSAFIALTGLVGYQIGGYVLGTFSVGGFEVFGCSVPRYVVPPLAVLVVVQFLFGMGESGAFPNITRALHNWFPYRERGIAQGAVWMSGRLMGGLTPIVWTLLVAGVTYSAASGDGERETLTEPLIPWRATFWVFGLVGVVWCLLFAWWFRNRPEEKQSVNAAELALIQSNAAESKAAHAGIPWGRIVTSRNLWLLCLMYFCQSYGWYFYITYLPRFLADQHGIQPTDLVGAIYKGGPLWMGAIGCLTGGILSDRFIRRTGNRRWGRSLFGMVGHSLAALSFLTVYLFESRENRPGPFAFFVAISLAGFFTDLTMGSAWAACQDIGKRYSAIVAGFMNMIGNLGGFLATLTSAWVLKRALSAYALKLGYEATEKLSAAEQLSAVEKTTGLLHGYQTNFLLFAGVFVVGMICWSQIDATKPIVKEDL